MPKGNRAGLGGCLAEVCGTQSCYLSVLAVGAGLLSDLEDSDLVSGFDSVLPFLAEDPFLESGTEVLPLP